MVVFTCQNCNSCLKKKAVENHLYKCKNPQLTCIDCLKDFDCRSYVAHVTCVTENERYGGQGFVPSVAMQKQNQWNRSIEVALQRNLSPPVLRNILQYASENPNCPKNKKKFINFVLNNKSFKSREAVEKAFDIILEESNKLVATEDQDKNGEVKNGNTAAKSTGGKRKTISETETQQELENSPSITEKKEKNNKKLNGDSEQTNGTTENTNKKKNKKKDKRNNSESINEEEVSKKTLDHSKVTGSENEEVHIPESTQGKKKKKNKDKHRKNSTNGMNSEENNDEDLDENEKPENCDQTENLNGEESNNHELLKDEDLSKLSKKERKKLLKQRKYAAEIVSIENYKKEDEENVEVQEEQEKRKKKKKKHQIEEEESNRQQKNSLSEPEDKKIKLEVEQELNEDVSAQVEKPKKFKWDEIIMQVLQTQDDGEMSLKRLSKKVCAEYSNVYGERESYEEVLLKFNKKVLRTPGVRVLKDRAKLLTDS